jgi:hypothetical protein
MSPENSPGGNDEPTVRCPVEGCGAERLSRGIYLHVRQSAGRGHGPQGEVPEHLDFDNLEVVGSRHVDVNYPEDREVEAVARLCPYCQRPYRGKHGVLIHLGQMAGRKNHPKNASEVHEPQDFPVVQLDEHDNIVAVVEGKLPGSSETRPDEMTVPVERVYRYIADLVSEGRSVEAAEARQRLLDEQ